MKKRKTVFYLRWMTGSSAVLIASQLAIASDMVPVKSHYYYDLGGGSDFILPPVQTTTTLRIGGDVNTNLGLNCGAFNPGVSLTNSLNDLQNTVEGLPEDIVASAEGAVGALPMYALEKANPNLYNIVQNALSGAEETFKLSMKSCQQAENQIKKGQSPYQNWFSLSDSEGWIKGANDAKQSNSTTDINATYNDTVSHGDQNGMPWVHKGQNSGGSQSGQVPIKVINDVAVAGYNILVDPTRALDSNDAPAKGQNDYLTVYWPRPDDAGAWATKVLGDMTITTNQNADQSTVAGVGLTALMSTCPTDIGNPDKTCARTIQNNLANLVKQSDAATPAELRAVSASSLVITQQVINSIKNQDAEDASLSVDKLAQNVATQNLVEEALLMRRVLLSGSQAQAVLNLKPAQANIQKALTQLDNDIQNVMFEHNVRQQLMTNTLQTVLGDESGKEAQASSSEGETGKAPMTQGAVYDSL